MGNEGSKPELDPEASQRLLEGQSSELSKYLDLATRSTSETEGGFYTQELSQAMSHADVDSPKKLNEKYTARTGHGCMQRDRMHEKLLETLQTATTPLLKQALGIVLKHLPSIGPEEDLNRFCQTISTFFFWVVKSLVALESEVEKARSVGAMQLLEEMTTKLPAFRKTFRCWAIEQTNGACLMLREVCEAVSSLNLENIDILDVDFTTQEDEEFNEDMSIFTDPLSEAVSTMLKLNVLCKHFKKILECLKVLLMRGDDQRDNFERLCGEQKRVGETQGLEVDAAEILLGKLRKHSQRAHPESPIRRVCDQLQLRVSLERRTKDRDALEEEATGLIGQSETRLASLAQLNQQFCDQYLSPGRVTVEAFEKKFQALLFEATTQLQALEAAVLIGHTDEQIFSLRHALRAQINYAFDHLPSVSEIPCILANSQTLFDGIQVCLDMPYISSVPGKKDVEHHSWLSMIGILLAQAHWEHGVLESLVAKLSATEGEGAEQAVSGSSKGRRGRSRRWATTGATGQSLDELTKMATLQKGLGEQIRYIEVYILGVVAREK